MSGHPYRGQRELETAAAGGTKILFAMDHYSEQQYAHLRDAVAPWGRIRRIPEGTPEVAYREALDWADVAVGWPSAHLLQEAKLAFVQIGSAGVESYLDRVYSHEEMKICSARGVYAITMAEHALALMLAFLRKLPAHLRDGDQRRGRRYQSYGDACGATACIVGMGHAGTALAQRCRALGMRVIGVDRDKPDLETLLDRRFPREALGDGIAEADHLFLMTSGGPATHHLVDAAILARMKPTAYLFNLSRGSVIDEAALAAALREGRIAGAGLDVTEIEPLPPESPLWAMENVILTAHSGGHSPASYDRLLTLIVDNLGRFHRGRPLQNQVYP